MLISPLSFHSGPFYGDLVSKVVAQEKPGLQELSLTAVMLWCNQQIIYAKIRLQSIIKSILFLRQNTSPLIHFLPAKMKMCEFLSQNYYSLTLSQRKSLLSLIDSLNLKNTQLFSGNSLCKTSLMIFEVQTITIKGQNTLAPMLQCKFHLIDHQNMHDKITSDRRSYGLDQIALCALHSFLVGVQRKLQSATKSVETLCPKTRIFLCFTDFKRRIYYSFSSPIPSMQCCADVQTTYTRHQTPQLWMEGTGEGCRFFGSLKVSYLSTMSQQFCCRL